MPLMTALNASDGTPPKYSFNQHQMFANTIKFHVGYLVQISSFGLLQAFIKTRSYLLNVTCVCNINYMSDLFTLNSLRHV